MIELYNSRPRPLGACSGLHGLQAEGLSLLLPPASVLG